MFVSQAPRLEFFLPFGFCPPKVGPVVCVSFVYGEICAEIFVSLFVFPLMVKAEWGGNPVCWWYGLYFCLLFRWGVLHRVLLVVVWSCVQVVSFVWVLTIWYSLGLVLWSSRVLESVLPFQRLKAWSLLWPHFNNVSSVSINLEVQA